MAVVQNSGLIRFDGVSGAQTFNMPSAFSAANLGAVAVAVYNNGTNTDLTSVSIGGTAATRRADATADLSNSGEIWIAENMAGGTTAVVMTGGTSYYYSGGCIEVSNVPASSFDQANTSALTASNAPSVSTTGALAQADSLAIAMFVQMDGATPTINNPPAGWTAIFEEEDGVNHEPGAACYKIVSSTAAITCTWSLSSSQNWQAAIVILKINAGGGSTSAQLTSSAPPPKAPDAPKPQIVQGFGSPPVVPAGTTVQAAAVPSPSNLLARARVLTGVAPVVAAAAATILAPAQLPPASPGLAYPALFTGIAPPDPQPGVVSAAPVPKSPSVALAPQLIVGAGSPAVVAVGTVVSAEPLPAASPTSSLGPRSIAGSGQAAQVAAIEVVSLPLDPPSLQPRPQMVAGFGQAAQVAAIAVVALPPDPPSLKPKAQQVAGFGQAAQVATIAAALPPLDATTQQPRPQLVAGFGQAAQNPAFVQAEVPPQSPQLPPSPSLVAGFGQAAQVATILPAQLQVTSPALPWQATLAAGVVPQPSGPAVLAVRALAPLTTDLPPKPQLVAGTGQAAPPDPAGSVVQARPPLLVPLPPKPVSVAGFGQAAQVASISRALPPLDVPLPPRPQLFAGVAPPFVPATLVQVASVDPPLLPPKARIVAGFGQAAQTPTLTNAALLPPAPALPPVPLVALGVAPPPPAPIPLAPTQAAQLAPRAELPYAPRLIAGANPPPAPIPLRPVTAAYAPSLELPPRPLVAAGFGEPAQSASLVIALPPPKLPPVPVPGLFVGIGSPIFPPFIPSTEVVFVPTVVSTIVVPFIPSTSGVFEPVFGRGVVPPRIESTTVVFAPTFERRPEQILALVDSDSAEDVNLVYRGGDGRLYLTPLQPKDARRHALETLRRFISLLTFRREVAVGEEDGRAFRVPLDSIHLAQPRDTGGADANLPAITFLGGEGTTDTLGIGGVQILEDTYGIEGEGTVIGRYGEWVETFVIEVLAESESKRQGIVAGLKQAFSIVTLWNTLRLRLDEFFGVVANFELETVQYLDEPYAAQNRLRAILRVTLTVPELFVVRGVPLFDPRVLIEAGAEIVILPRVDDRT